MMPTLNIDIFCEDCGGHIMKGTLYIEQGNNLIVSTQNHNCGEYKTNWDEE